VSLAILVADQSSTICPMTTEDSPPLTVADLQAKIANLNLALEAREVHRPGQGHPHGHPRHGKSGGLRAPHQDIAALRDEGAKTVAAQLVDDLVAGVSSQLTTPAGLTSCLGRGCQGSATS
jgi:hypothetical protein